MASDLLSVDHEVLPPHNVTEPVDAAWLADKAERIRLRGQRITSDIIAIGQDLIEVQGRIGGGEAFEVWIEREFRWTRDTAFRFISVARRFITSGGIYEIPDGVTNIEVGALYLLAAPRMPRPVREAVIERAEAGERITKAEAERMIAEAEEAATERAAQAIRDAEVQQADAAAVARARINDLENRLARDANTIAERDRLIAELEQARDEAREAPVADHINRADPLEILSDMLGTSRVTEKQVRGLAVALGRPLVFNGRTVPPATAEEEEAAREKVRLGGAVVSALVAFNALPEPAAVRAHMTDAHRDEAERLAKQARRWIDAFIKAGKELQQ